MLAPKLLSITALHRLCLLALAGFLFGACTDIGDRHPNGFTEFPVAPANQGLGEPGIGEPGTGEPGTGEPVTGEPGEPGTGVPCEPSCAGKTCGTDGCEGFCPNTCSDTQVCDYEADTCVALTCTPGSTFCDGSMAAVCNAQGTGKELFGQQNCGADKQTCVNGTCVPLVCTPNASFCGANGELFTCNALGTGAGPGVTQCSQLFGGAGTCQDMDLNGDGIAEDAACACAPQCTGKICGSNGCGGVCGACGPDSNCSAGGQCEKICVGNCSLKSCGDDGCGNSCGSCTFPSSCTVAGQCDFGSPFNYLASPGPGSDSAWLAAPYNDSFPGLQGPLPVGSGTSHWAVSNPGIPEALVMPFAGPVNGGNCVPGNGETGSALWQHENDHVTVCWAPRTDGTYRVQLTQRGTSDLCGSLFATFVAPTGPKHSVKVGGANLGFAMDSPALSELSQLRLRFGAELTTADVVSPCQDGNACTGSGPKSVGQVLARVELTRIVGSYQKIFYQVGLFDTRQEQSCSADFTQSPCTFQSGPNWWMADGTEFGFTDGAADFPGAQCLGSGQPRQFYDLDILPKIIDGIAEGAPAGGPQLDGNLNHWKVTYLSFATVVSGAVNQTVLIDNIQLEGHH